MTTITVERYGLHDGEIQVESITWVENAEHPSAVGVILPGESEFRFLVPFVVSAPLVATDDYGNYYARLLPNGMKLVEKEHGEALLQAQVEQRAKERSNLKEARGAQRATLLADKVYKALFDMGLADEACSLIAGAVQATAREYVPGVPKN